MLVTQINTAKNNPLTISSKNVNKYALLSSYVEEFVNQHESIEEIALTHFDA